MFHVLSSRKVPGVLEPSLCSQYTAIKSTDEQERIGAPKDKETENVGSCPALQRASLGSVMIRRSHPTTNLLFSPGKEPTAEASRTQTGGPQTEQRILSGTGRALPLLGPLRTFMHLLTSDL